MCFAKRPQCTSSDEECTGMVDFRQPVRVAGDHYGYACEKCGAVYDHTGRRLESPHFTVEKKKDDSVVLRNKITGHEDFVHLASSPPPPAPVPIIPKAK